MYMCIYIYNACEFVLCFIILLHQYRMASTPDQFVEITTEDGVLRWNNPPRGATDRVSGFRRHLSHWKAIISGELQKDEALIWKLRASSAKHIFLKAWIHINSKFRSITFKKTYHIFPSFSIIFLPKKYLTQVPAGSRRPDLSRVLVFSPRENGEGSPWLHRGLGLCSFQRLGSGDSNISNPSPGWVKPP